MRHVIVGHLGFIIASLQESTTSSVLWWVVGCLWLIVGLLKVLLRED